MECQTSARSFREPWNKGKLVGQRAPLKLKEIWAIRVRLRLADRRRELALFNLAIDSKLRACDLVKLRVRDVCHGQAVASRTTPGLWIPGSGSWDWTRQATGRTPSGGRRPR